MDGFWEQLEAYARSYLPEWNYTRGGPEVESALLTVLGELAQSAREGLEGLPEKLLREYLRGFGLERLPGTPMRAYAALRAPGGAAVPKGSRFYRSGDGAKLWETEEELWAQPLGLAEQLLTGRASGKVLRLPIPGPDGPVRLFDFRPCGIQRREARFSHPSAFASPGGCAVSLLLEGACDGLLDFLQDPGRADWFLEGASCTAALPAPARRGGELRFQLPPAGDARALLARARDGETPPADPLGRVLLRTARPAPSQYTVLTQAGFAAERTWLPFGERLSPWSSCCIACPEALSLRGGEVSLSWTQSFRIQEDRGPEAGQEPAYRPIMRRLPPPPPAVRDVYASQVLWEYWDGRTWRPVPGTQACTRLFSAENGFHGRAARLEARFSWPQDAAPCELQGMEEYWLRWRLTRCVGAEWFPARHHVPEVTDLRLSARLAGAEAGVERRCGLEEGFTALTGERRVLFPAFLPPGNVWWLGFDRPPASASLRLYLSLEGRACGGGLSAWEAGPGGRETPLAMRDGTQGLAHSGMIALGGIRGRPCVRFGRELWWIGFREEGEPGRGGRGPVLRQLSSGAARLRACGGDACAPGEPLTPLRGGAVSGVSLTQSFGGTAEETDLELTRRAQNERHNQGRIVSGLDAEQVICGRMRDVARVRCVRAGGALWVGVLMRDTAHHAAAFRLRQGEIQRLLEQSSALPSLGLDIQIREPCFYPLHVAVWLRTPPGASLEEIRRRLESALERFLDPACGHFDGGGWPMGGLPAAGQLRTCLGSAAPGAALVQLVYTVTAPDGSEREASAIQDPFALPADGSCTVHALKEGESA